MKLPFPRGVVSVVQTPFGTGGELDLASLRRLTLDAVAAGVDGFLVPAAASEADCLSDGERDQILTAIQSASGGKVPLILGASAQTAGEVRRHARRAMDHGATAWLAAVALYHRLLPVLAFSNQDLATSILFFKKLLVRKGIFATAFLRCSPPPWDRYSERRAEELIDHCLELEKDSECKQWIPPVQSMP